MQALKRYYKIIALPLFQDNYSYIVAGTAKRRLVLVDPANPDVVMNYLNTNFPEHLISHVLYTHKHWDHEGGSEQLSAQLKALNPEVKIVIGDNDKDFVKGTNHFLQVNQELTIGQSQVKTIHVPCHTRGHTIYSFLPIQENLLAEQQDLTPMTIQGKKVRTFDSHSCTFTGDTLFVGGIGRFFQGNAAEMAKNIENMYKIIDLDSEIFCGHEYALANLKWGTSVEKDNTDMKEFYSELEKASNSQGGVCSIPSSLKK